MDDTDRYNRTQWTHLRKVLINREKTAVIWIVCNDYFYRSELLERFKREFDNFKHFTVSLKHFYEKKLESFFRKQLPKDIFIRLSTLPKLKAKFPFISKKKKTKNLFLMF